MSLSRNPPPPSGNALVVEGASVAQVIAARVRGRTAPGPFTYRHQGSLATVGRQAAVADFGWLQLSGAPAWWLWGLVHVFFLLGMRNPISVTWNWFWAYLSLRSGTRLITGEPEPNLQPRPGPAADPSWVHAV